MLEVKKHQREGSRAQQTVGKALIMAWFHSKCRGKAGTKPFSEEPLAFHFIETMSLVGSSACEKGYETSPTELAMRDNNWKKTDKIKFSESVQCLRNRAAS